MKNILNEKVFRDAVRNICFRSEHQSPKSIVKTFYDPNIIELMENRNNQLLQGRRGTGKTHIFRVLSERMETSSQHCFYFDCRQVGSARSVSDVHLPANHRVMQVLRDFLSAFHRNLFEYYDKFAYDFGPEEHGLYEIISNFLDCLFKECFSVEQIIDTYSQTLNDKHKEKHQDDMEAHFSFPISPSINLDGEDHFEKESVFSTVENVSGQKFSHIAFPNVYDCLQQITSITRKKFIVLIDEWSSLPLDIQIHFAEFLRKCLLPNHDITVKIAVVSNRTQLCKKRGSIMYGLEVGADISLSLDLDNMYMFDAKPDTVIAMLYQILVKHLNANNNEILEINIDDIFNCFSDTRAVFLLARAAEGNPRDFICLLYQCLAELQNSRIREYVISSEIICNAVHYWCENDKIPALDAQQLALLGKLISQVVIENGNRGFLIKEEYLNNPDMLSLIDARLIHVLQTGRIENGTRFALLILDFGAYVQEFRTGREIHFWVPSKEQRFYTIERIIFSTLTDYSNDVILPYMSGMKFRACYI